MPSATKTFGREGIIRVTSEDGTVEEVPCLYNWTLDGTANNESDDTECMASNGDGGADAINPGPSRTPGTPDYSLSCEHFWQRSQDAGSSANLTITDQGKKYDIVLFPNGNTPGEISFIGRFMLASTNLTSSTRETIKSSVSFEIDGRLTSEVIA